MGAGFA